MTKYNEALDSYNVSARGSNEAINYTTDGSEIKTNKTFDGKEIYVTTIKGTLTSGTGTLFKDLTSYNIDKVISTYGFFYGDSGATYGNINLYYNSAANTSFWYNIPSKKMYYICGTQYNGATAYVTLEYIKSI